MGNPTGTQEIGGPFTSGTFSATGVSGALPLRGDFNLSVWGTFVASLDLERSFDGGTTWLNCSLDTYGTVNSLTLPLSIVCREPENGVLYRLNCTAYTSGTVSWRLSQ